MTSDETQAPKESVQVRWMRFAFALAGMAAAWFALDAAMDFAAAHGGATLYGAGFLVLIPFAVGLILGVVIQRFWLSTNGLKVGLWAALVFAVLSLFTGPGVICVIIAGPLWVSGLVLGGWASNLIVRRTPLVQAAATALVLVLACGVWATDGIGRYSHHQYTVERSVIVEASPDQIWPHLLRLNNLSTEEGLWTVSHNVLGVPRPVDAVVTGEGIGAVRTGRWSGGVWFEERIVNWSRARQLDWTFVFPEGSTFTSIDQHIDPRGPNVVVQYGGYRLSALPDGATRLNLHTTYSLTTAVNGYAHLWGERILGDVQSNILEIVRVRAENGSDTHGPILAGQVGETR